jgi:hypothetical protein
MTSADEPLLLRPYPNSVGVVVHPHPDGDVLSEVFIDAATGQRVIILRDPATANRIGEDLVMATTDADIAAEAERIRDSK